MNARRPFFQRMFVDWKSRWTSAFGSFSRIAATLPSSVRTAAGSSRPKRVPRQCCAKRSRSHAHVAPSNGGRRSGRSGAAPSALNAASASTTFTYSSSVIFFSTPACERTSVLRDGSSNRTSGTGTPFAFSQRACPAYFPFS